MWKSVIQSCLRPLGVQLHRIPKQEEINEIERIKTLWLRKRGIKTILDIGANTGQFAMQIHKMFPEAIIYSFEPIKECYEELLRNFAEVPKFSAFNLALGNQLGEVEIYKNEYSPSSSLLPMAELHKTSFPYTRNETLEKIKLMKLDDIISQLTIIQPMLIKMDVQGFEDKVIEGGINTFSQANIVITELSVEELYKEQKLFDDIYTMLKKLGFQYQGNYEQLYNLEDGRVLQMDGIFIRNKTI